MNVANLELCKELYELSGWQSEYWYSGFPHQNGSFSYDGKIIQSNDRPEQERRGWRKGDIPAYDLGYLLRRLPANFNTGDARGSFELFIKKTSREYFAGYNKPELGKWLYDQNHAVWEHPCGADTPEDAAAKLAIELLKQKVIEV